jgi:DNA-binding SARP family transcriptional activator
MPLPNLPSLVGEVRRCLMRDDAPIEHASTDAAAVGDTVTTESVGTDRLRAALAPIIEELRWARREAQADVEWHQQALDSARERAAVLDRRLASYNHLIPAEGDRRASAPTRRSPGEEAHVGVASERAALAIFCFGSFRVCANGHWIDDWHGTRSQTILKHLVTHGRKPVARDLLMSTFWPDADEESARRNVHQAIYNLRQALRLEWPTVSPIVLDNGRYRLNGDVAIWVDVEAFEERVRAGRALARDGKPKEAALTLASAIELYQGDFLAEDADEGWAIARREGLRREFIDAADWLSSYLLDKQEHTGAELVCQRLVELDPCNEPAHCRLMRCYLQRGLRALAIRQYHACMAALRTELGVPPGPETRTLFERMLRDERGDKMRPPVLKVGLSES